MQRLSFSIAQSARLRAVFTTAQCGRLNSVTMRYAPVHGSAALCAPFAVRRWYTAAAAAEPLPGIPGAAVGKAQYAAPGSALPPPFGAAAPSAAGEPALGTEARPLVIVSPPAPKTWTSRLWAAVVVVIGVSAALHIMDAFDARSGADAGAGAAGAGGHGGRAALFGSQDVKPVDLDATTVRFADIQGIDEAKEELADMVAFLKDPSKFHAMGARLPKGALLVGPPGGGKTMLAKAIAKEAGVTFFYCSGSEFDEMFVGVGSRRVRELFKAAKEHSPALIFIDEIDAMGGKRTGKDTASQNRMTLNQLLTEMDGFNASDSVVVLAATNTPESLDSALTRPGRFDTSISIDPPDVRGREAILRSYMAKVKADRSVDAAEVAKGTAGMTGAELANLVNIAAIRAVVTGRAHVSSAEIDYAKDRVLMGAEARTKVIPDAEKRVTAFHEGGHALVAMLLENEGADPVHKATIVPRGSGILGLVQQQPKEDRYSQSRRQMLARLKVCLAGRIAEELLLGDDDVTSGAASDFQQATAIARAMVRRFGFSTTGLGTIDYGSADSSEGAFMSDATKQRIEDEVRRIVQTSYDGAKEMLQANRPHLDLIAAKLLHHETLSGEQLRAIVAGQEMPENGFAAPPSRQPPRPPTGGNAVQGSVVKPHRGRPVPQPAPAL